MIKKEMIAKPSWCFNIKGGKTGSFFWWKVSYYRLPVK